MITYTLGPSGGGKTILLPDEWVYWDSPQKSAWIASSDLSAEDATALEEDVGLDVYGAGTSPGTQTGSAALQQAARAGDKNALAQLAASGSFTAKLAQTLGVSLGTGEALLVGGAALLAVVVVGIVAKD